VAQGNRSKKRRFSKLVLGSRCPICGPVHRQGTVEEDPNGILAIDCTNDCGRFEMERDLAHELRKIHLDNRDNQKNPHPDTKLIRYLSCHTRQPHTEAETAPPMRSDSWRELAGRAQGYAARREA